MKKNNIISVITASLLLSSTLLLANSNAKQTEAQEFVQSVQKQENNQAQSETPLFQKEAKEDAKARLTKVVHAEYAKHQTGLKQAPKELLQGVEKVIIAIKELDAKKTTDAQKALEDASKLFDQGIKTAPQMTTFPVADTIDVHEFTGDAKLVAHIKETAIKLLQENDTQAAIDILEPLQDEMLMTTKSIPVKIYPVAIKSALQSIKEGKNEQALNTLVVALNTVITEITIIPIPLATAQDLVMEASLLKTSDKKGAILLLDAAQDELQKAIYLGYTKKHESSYKALDTEIKNLKNVIQGKNVVEKLYDHLLNSFQDLKDEHTPSKK